MLFLLNKEKPLRELTAPENQAITTWWSGSSTAANPSAADIIRYAREECFWFGCACRGAEQMMPILAPFLVGSTYSLRRLTKRPMHAPDCCYFAEAKQVAAERDVGSDCQASDQAPSFNLSPSVATRFAAKDEGDHRASVASPMARRLWWLAHQAGWQKIPRESRSDIGSVLAVAKALPLEGKRPLKLYCNTRAWSEDWIFSDLEASGKDAVSWMLVVIDEIDRKRNTIVVRNSVDGLPQLVIPVKRIEVCAGASSARYPLLGLAAIRLVESALSVVEIYAQPVFSGTNWTLIWNVEQRQTLAKLLALRSWLKKEKGVALSIEKPLFAWARTNYVPDFVLTKFNRDGVAKHLIVETVVGQDYDFEKRSAFLRGAEVFCDEDEELNPNLLRWAIRA